MVALPGSKDVTNQSMSSKAGLLGLARQTSTPSLPSLKRGLGSWRPATTLLPAPRALGALRLLLAWCRIPNEMMMMMMMIMMMVMMMMIEFLDNGDGETTLLAKNSLQAGSSAVEPRLHGGSLLSQMFSRCFSPVSCRSLPSECAALISLVTKIMDKICFP